MARHVETVPPRDDVPAGMTPEEWQLRVDLAAAYRLAALYGWTDLNNTHFSVRIPGLEHHFLLNPFGLLFDEITASSLIKVDQAGNILGDSDYPANPAGFNIHGAIHMAVPKAQCIIHTHSRFGARYNLACTCMAKVVLSKWGASGRHCCVSWNGLTAQHTGPSH